MQFSSPVEKNGAKNTNKLFTQTTNGQQTEKVLLIREIQI